MKKFHDWSDCILLREIESLRALSLHPNIVQVHEVIREDDSKLHFVFEYMPDGSLFDLIQSYTLESLSNPRRSAVREDVRKINKLKSIAHQVLDALSFMHSNGYVHRDIKPENILLKGNICKLADFGMTRKIQMDFRSYSPLTEYVSTRWYRAPELLLRCPKYGPSIDVFATGCVFVEMMTLKPLFPGKSEMDQLFRICSLLGDPQSHGWTEGHQLASKMNFNIKREDCPGQGKNQSLNDYLNRNIHKDFTALISSMIQLNPKYRITASKALQLTTIAFNQTSHNLYQITDTDIGPSNKCGKSPLAMGYVSNQGIPFNQSPPSSQENIFSKCIQKSLIKTPPKKEWNDPMINNYTFDSRKTTPSLASECGYSPVNFSNVTNHSSLSHTNSNISLNCDDNFLNLSEKYDQRRQLQFRSKVFNVPKSIPRCDSIQSTNSNLSFHCPLEMQHATTQHYDFQNSNRYQNFQDQEIFGIQTTNQKNSHQNEFAECIKRSSSTHLPNSNWDRKRYSNSNEDSRPIRKSFRTAGIDNISRPYTIPSRMVNSSQVLNKSTRGFGKRKFR